MSTYFNFKISLICSSIYRSLKLIFPRLSTFSKKNSLLFIKFNNCFPSSALINSPFSFKSLSAFHCFGLWLAVKMIPPSAFSFGTAISTVGVVDKPIFTTSIPIPCRVPTQIFSTISPEILASLPITIFNFLFLFFCLSQVP